MNCLLSKIFMAKNYYPIVKINMGEITSIFMLKNNKNAIVFSKDSSIFKIKWQKNIRSENDFDIDESYGKIVLFRATYSIYLLNEVYAYSIHLQNDEKNLWLSTVKDVRVFNFKTRKVIKTFKLIEEHRFDPGLKDIGFFENDSIAILVKQAGDLTFIDIGSMKILGTIENITKGHSVTFAKIL